MAIRPFRPEAQLQFHQRVLAENRARRLTYKVLGERVQAQLERHEYVKVPSQKYLKREVFYLVWRDVFRMVSVATLTRNYTMDSGLRLKYGLGRRVRQYTLLGDVCIASPHWYALPQWDEWLTRYLFVRYAEWELWKIGRGQWRQAWLKNQLIPLPLERKSLV